MVLAQPRSQGTTQSERAEKQGGRRLWGSPALTSHSHFPLLAGCPHQRHSSVPTAHTHHFLPRLSLPPVCTVVAAQHTALTSIRSVSFSSHCRMFSGPGTASLPSSTWSYKITSTGTNSLGNMLCPSTSHNVYTLSPRGYVHNMLLALLGCAPVEQCPSLWLLQDSVDFLLADAINAKSRTPAPRRRQSYRSWMTASPNPSTSSRTRSCSPSSSSSRARTSHAWGGDMAAVPAGRPAHQAQGPRGGWAQQPGQRHHVARGKLQEKMPQREEGENTIQSLRKDVNSAFLACLDLERKVESLQEEIAFSKKPYDQKSKSCRPRFRNSMSKLMWVFPSLTSWLPCLMYEVWNLGFQEPSGGWGIIQVQVCWPLRDC